MTEPARSADVRSASPSVRPRAIGVGLAIAVWINVFDPVSRYFIRSSSFTSSQLPFAALGAVLAIAYLWNPVFRTWRPALVFTRADLAAAFALGLVGGGVPIFGSDFLALISAPDYFGTPENEWPTYVIPNLQRWLVPSNETGGVAGFYRGLGPGQNPVWGVWFEPLFWWMAIVCAIVVACACLSVVLRKQWSENERLAYPMVDLPMLLMSDPQPGRRFPDFVRDRLFWLGFAIPAVMLGWNTAGHFLEGLPHFSFLNANNLTDLGRGFPQLYLRFDFYVICFAFLSTLDILLSMWLFHLLAVLQIGLSNRVGLLPDVGDAGVPAMNTYGLVVFVAWGLWISRSHLLDVWRKVVGSAPDVDDSGEFLSYRFSVVGLAVSLLFLFFILLKMRMSPAVALSFIGFTFVLYLSMAKIVALSGLVSVRGPNPAGAARDLVGTWNMTDTSIASLAQMSALYGNAKGFIMPGAVNAAKAGEYTAPRRRRMGAAVIAAGILGVGAFLVTSLLLGYFGPGAESFGSYDYNTGNRFAYNSIVSSIKDRPEAARNGWELAIGLFGAAATWVLLLLNQRLPAWPLHPVGFVISYQYPTRAAFFSVFFAWLVKFVIIRVGGIETYNRSKVVIVGVLLGYSLFVVVSFLLDTAFFWGQGHSLHTPPI